MAGFFGFMDFTKEGPGIKKDGPKKKAFFVFFETYFRNFWRFITINLVYVLLSLPIITTGMTSAGLTHVARNIARDKHSFGLSDFFETIKKNFKQALAVGIINVIITAIITFAIYIYYKSFVTAETRSTFNLLGFIVSLIVAMVFLMMQFYMYTLMITFGFSVKTLYVNSFKFVFVNLWKNLLCGILLLLVYGIYVAIFMAFPYWSVLLVEVLIAAITLPSFRYLLIQFFTFGSIKKYIIDPYYKEHPDADIDKRRDLGLEVPEDDDEEGEEPISWE